MADLILLLAGALCALASIVSAHIFCGSAIVDLQPSPSRSEASARKNVDVIRDWELGVTSQLKML
jgi:hypothetical protein